MKYRHRDELHNILALPILRLWKFFVPDDVAVPSGIRSYTPPYLSIRGISSANSAATEIPLRHCYRAIRCLLDFEHFPFLSSCLPGRKRRASSAPRLAKQRTRSEQRAPNLIIEKVPGVRNLTSNSSTKVPPASASFSSFAVRFPCVQPNDPGNLTAKEIPRRIDM